MMRIKGGGKGEKNLRGGGNGREGGRKKGKKVNQKEGQ